MNPIALLHGEPGSGVNVVRVHNGFMFVMPPNPPVLAEDSQELLGVLADWLGMHKPGKPRAPKDATEEALTIEERPRFPWAVKQTSLNIGSTLLVAKCQRGRSKTEHGYMVTHHFALQNTLWQGALWTPMAVLEHANDWLGSVPMMRTEQLHAMRLVGNLDFELPEVFALTVHLTASLPPEAPCPSREAPWTVLSAAPSIQCGIGDGPIADYFEQACAGESGAVFAARLRNHTLEIGQRLSPDLIEPDESDA